MLGLMALNLSLLLSVGGMGWYYRLWGLCVGSFLSVLGLWSGSLNSLGAASWLMADGLSSSLVMLTWWISMLMVVASQGVKLKKNKIFMFTFFVCALNFVLG